MSIRVSSRGIFLVAVTWWAVLDWMTNLSTWETSTFLIAGMAAAAVYKYIWEGK